MEECEICGKELEETDLIPSYISVCGIIKDGFQKHISTCKGCFTHNPQAIFEKLQNKEGYE